jgi:hypothetical protein
MLPVGAMGEPAPGPTTPNVKDTVIGWFTNTVEGNTELMLVAVLALFTVCEMGAPVELLPLKFASPV